MATGVGALTIWGVRWKIRAGRAKRQIDDFQRSSDRWEKSAAERAEKVRKDAAEREPVDPSDRTGLE